MNNPDTLEQLFINHASQCQKGNKCCFSIDNSSTQEFEQQLIQWRATTLLEMIGEDDTDTRSPSQNPTNPNYHTKRANHRNELRAELRRKVEGV